MNELQDKLHQQGWYLTDESIYSCLNLESDDSLPKNLRLEEITRPCLNLDFKDVGAPSAKSATKGTALHGPLILQVQKIRDVLIPEIKQFGGGGGGNNCLLRVTLTDGHTTLTALDENISVKNLNSNTHPGAKVLLKGQVPMEYGFLMLSNKNCEVLGGEVEHLVQKWKIQKDSLMASRTRPVGGAPPWAPFGQRIQGMKDATKNFKALGLNTEQANSDEPSEFDEARKEAIAEVYVHGAAAKKFESAMPQIQVQSQPTPETATAAAPAAAAYRKPGTMTKREVKQAMVRNDPDRPERNEQDKPAGAQATLFDFLQGKVVPNSGTGDNDSEEPERYETDRYENAYRGGARGAQRGGRRGRGEGRGRGGGRGEGNFYENDDNLSRGLQEMQIGGRGFGRGRGGGRGGREGGRGGRGGGRGGRGGNFQSQDQRQSYQEFSQNSGGKSNVRGYQTTEEAFPPLGGMGPPAQAQVQVQTQASNQRPPPNKGMTPRFNLPPPGTRVLAAHPADNRVYEATIRSFNPNGVVEVFFGDGSIQYVAAEAIFPR